MNPSPAVRLRSLAHGDAHAVHRLWSTRFGGRSERIRNWIDAALNPKAATTAHVAVPVPAKGASPSIVGFGILEIGSRAYTLDYLGVDELEIEIDVAEPSGVFHMYCVDRNWEGRGIATRLYRRHLRHLRENEVPQAVGISWHRPHRQGADSRVVFEKTGFRRVGTFEAYYARTSPRENCPDCHGACRCTASIYEKTLAETGGDGEQAAFGEDLRR